MVKSLGKGLQSLIPKKESRIKDLIKSQGGLGDWKKFQRESVFNVEIDKISPNPSQPRKDLSDESLKELADSIREHGILQPLVVTKVEKTTDRGRQVEYELIAGERRWRAAKKAGLPSVPVVIRDSSANEKLELALVENIQRENLNAIDAALAFKQLHKEFGLKHHEIAKKVGKSRMTITNTMRLLNLPLKVQTAISSGKLAEGHGRAILMARPSAQMSLFQKIIGNNWSIRQAEDKARELVAENKARARGPKNPLFKKIEQDLRNVIGQRVSITQRGDFGHIRIEFVNKQEFDKLVDHLSKF